MPKRKFSESNWRTDPWFQSLCRAMFMCSTVKELENFLRDVGTLSELRAWSERWEVAQRIEMGQTYRQIAQKTGASTTTITRVGQFMWWCGAGGYWKALQSSTHPEHHSLSRDERMVSMTEK